MLSLRSIAWFALRGALILLAVAHASRADAANPPAVVPPGVVPGRPGPPRSATVPVLHARRTSVPPIIDGRLDDAAWARAIPVASFTQKIPESGRPPTSSTLLRVLYDDDALYVAFDCSQRTPVIGRLARRDRGVESDSVTISIDSRADSRSAFELSVSAAGVLTDGTRYDDMEYSADWDENWQAKTTRTKSGWSAEFRVPLRILRFDPAATAWGFQARRYYAARQEVDEWAFAPRDAGGEVSRYGRLVDLDLRASRQGVELRPFVVGSIRHQDPDPTIGWRGFAYAVSAGADLTWHPAPTLTLNATINPDFAQVEADQVVLNLTNQELLLPEKRPFFLDGADAFSTPIQLVYTRRIGRTPLTPLLETSEILYDRIQPTPVYGAAKLTGTLGRGWTFSALGALTGPNTVSIVNADGSTYPFPLDSTTAFGALRVTRAIGPRLRLGISATSVTRAESGYAPSWLAPSTQYPLSAPVGPSPSLQRCPDGSSSPIGARCTHDAYAGGLDFLWTSPSADYSVRGQVVGTAIANGPDRTMLDGTVIRSGDAAPAARLGISKDGGQHWVGTVGLRAHDRKVDYDDLGYMPRQNELRAAGYVGYRTLEAYGPLLETETGLTAIASENWDGLNLGRSAQAHTEIKWKSYWSTRLDAYVQTSRFDDREVGDGTALERAALQGLGESIGTDPRKALSARLQLSEERVDGGAYNLRLDGDIRWLPLSVLEIQVVPTAAIATGEPRYAGAANDGITPVFGRLTARDVGATLRVNYTFSPSVSLQTYAQLFTASEHFEGFTLTTRLRGFSAFHPPPAGQRVDLSSLQPWAPPAVNPDVQEGVLDVSVVLRWEYALGSTLYLVYARSQAPDPSLAFGEPPRLSALEVARAPAADMILAKLTYWFAP